LNSSWTGCLKRDGYLNKFPSCSILNRVTIRIRRISLLIQQYEEKKCPEYQIAYMCKKKKSTKDSSNLISSPPFSFLRIPLPFFLIRDPSSPLLPHHILSKPTEKEKGRYTIYNPLSHACPVTDTDTDNAHRSQANIQSISPKSRRRGAAV